MLCGLLPQFESIGMAPFCFSRCPSTCFGVPSGIEKPDFCFFRCLRRVQPEQFSRNNSAKTIQQRQFGRGSSAKSLQIRTACPRVQRGTHHKSPSMTTPSQKSIPDHPHAAGLPRLLRPHKRKGLYKIKCKVPSINLLPVRFRLFRIYKM